MDRLEAMRIFAVAAKSKSFSAAARTLGLSGPSVTRAVQGLERHLGAELFARTTRVAKLTELGQRYLLDVERVLSALAEAESAVQGALSTPSGELRVTAPVRFGTQFVAPSLFSFLEEHSGVSARLILNDRTMDLVEEGFDVAVRIGHLRDSSLMAVKVGYVRRLVCAAPRYLAKRGRPRSPLGLRNHDAILLPPDMALHEWAFANPRQRTAKPRQLTTPCARVMVSSVEAAVAASVAGLGVLRALSYQVQDELDAGNLEVLLEKFEPPKLPVHVVFSHARRSPLKVRLFVDHVVSELRAALSWHPKP